jgi:polysaccharide pyruvyl transferase WcaK-like protein
VNILIFEAYSDANIGACALVENAIALLHRRYPAAAIRVMAREPGVFRNLYGVDAVPDVFEYPFLQPRWRQVIWLVRALLWMASCWIAAGLHDRDRLRTTRVPFRSKIEDFLWADLAVSVGAERINDKFFKNIVFSLYTYALLRRIGARCVIFPATIGPFLFGWSRRLARRVLSGVDLIYTRDEASLEITRGLLGPGTGTVHGTSDIALMQEQIGRDEALTIIGAAGEESIVGISAMRWSYFRNRIETPYSNFEAYVREMALLADTLIDEYGVRIVMYPTNYPVHGCREDDLGVSLEIRSRMSRGKDVTVIEELPTPARLKGMLACSQINVTTRMHACILSTGAGAPTISVNYLFKVREHMRSLGLEEFSIDIEEFNSQWALETFRRMWPERERWRAHLERAVEEKQRGILDAMKYLDGVAR